MSAEAIELVRYHVDTGKFEVGEEALQILRNTRSPVSVVAVCGRARQGKSFILNQLLQVTGGFQIGSTTRPCTKGLWMWSQPQKRGDPDGNDYHIVLLDTEGIDAYDQTAQYSTQIFSLAVLLSSLFVYNQMGGIDEAALDRLSLVTEMTKHIRVRAGSKVTDTAELREFTPSFLWLLRDFYLKLEDEAGRKVTATDYLETALMPVPGTGPAVEAKNAIRYSIKSLFPDRDCATLVRPAHDEQALVNLAMAPPESLRPEFREGVGNLVSTIFKKAVPKRMGSTVLTGPMLAGLTQAYVKAINAGAVPAIATAWQGVAEQECRRAADVAEAAYMEAFDENVAAEEKVLDAEHMRALGVAKECYDENSVGDERIRKAHEAKYVDACTARYTQVRARKLAEAASAVNELLLRASTMVSNTMNLDGSPEELQNQLSAFLDQYVNMAAGPTKWTKLVDFLKNTYPQIMQGVVARKEEKARQEVSRLENELTEANRQTDNYREAAQQAAKQASSTQEQLDATQQELEKYTQKTQQLESSLEAARSQAEALSRQAADTSAELTAARVAGESNAGKVSALEAQVRELQLVAEKKLLAQQQEAEAALHHAELSAQQAQAALQAKLSAEQRRAQELTTEVTELSSRCRGLESALQTSKTEGERAAKRIEALTAQNATTTKQLDEARTIAQRLATEKAMVERERDQALAEAEDYASQLAEFDEEIDKHMTEALAERAKSAAMSRKGSILEDDMDRPPHGLIRAARH